MDTFEYDINNNCINPFTQKPFKYKDEWFNNTFFGKYKKVKINNEIKKYPRFYSSLQIEKQKKNNCIWRRNLLQLSSQLLKDAKHRAKHYNGLVTITKEWIFEQLKLGVCQGSFPPLHFVLDTPGSPYSPSLDRIDSKNRDYSIKNTRVVCLGINVARNKFTDVDISVISKRLHSFIHHRRNSI